jgi:beta-mannosidase
MAINALLLESNWRFREVEPGEKPDFAGRALPDKLGREGWLPARVPGCVHLDLQQAGRIPDPFHGSNDRACLWVENQDFVYKTSFILPRDWEAPPPQSGLRIELVFEALDTFAQIYLNGAFLGESTNAFLPLTLDVTDEVRPGENVLVVHFDATVKRTTAEELEHGRLQATHERTRVYARRPQFQTGWTNAPRLSGCGFPGPVILRRIDQLRCRNLSVHSTIQGTDAANLRIEADVEIFRAGPVDVDWVVERIEPVGSWTQYTARTVFEAHREFEVRPGSFRFSEKATLAQPTLWWPAGFGSGRRVLYRARMVATQEGRELEEVETIFGLRTAELTSVGGEEGSFAFKINGQKVFARGAIWIPPDVFPSRVSDEDYRHLLDLAAAANINMLRVWGAGRYESEAFYRRCDELGIMVWQDFMFSQGEYPDSQSLWQSAQREAKSQVRRLRSHPCIVMWCGNDGCENFHFRRSGTWQGQKGEKIFTRLLPHVTQEYDASRPYWRSTPFGGINPNSEREGDYHHERVWEGWEGDATYAKLRARFVSEFGLQSLPSEETIRLFTDKTDRTLNQPEYEAHQKQEDGNVRLFRYIVQRCRPPENFEEMVYLGQWVQANALTLAIDHWRANKPETMGALVWHFNDCWPGITWSLVDYGKRPKLAYWALRQAFAPTSLVLLEAEEGLRVAAMNDGPLRTANQDLVCHLKGFTLDGQVLDWVNRPVDLPAGGKVEVGLFALDSFGVKDPTNCVVVGDLCSGRSILSSRLFAPVDPKKAQYPEPKVSAELDCVIKGQRAVFLVRSDNIVRGVEIQAHGLAGARVRYENAFDLWPGREVWVQVDLEHEVPPETLIKSMRYRTLNDAMPGRAVHWRDLPVIHGRGLMSETGRLDQLLGDARMASSITVPKLQE